MATQNAGDKKINDDLIGGHHSFEAKDFFGDKKRGHRMGCTCFSLIVLLILAMLAVGTLIYLAGRSTDIILSTVTDDGGDVGASISSQVEDSIANKDKLATVTVTESSFVAFLPTANMDVAIRPQNIFVTTKYMGFDCLMEVEPYIAEGQLKFKVKSAKIGALPMPGFMTGPISAGFATATVNLTKELSNINFETVEKQDGKLVLTGKVVGR